MLYFSPLLLLQLWGLNPSFVCTVSSFSELDLFIRTAFSESCIIHYILNLIRVCFSTYWWVLLPQLTRLGTAVCLFFSFLLYCIIDRLVHWFLHLSLVLQLVTYSHGNLKTNCMSSKWLHTVYCWNWLIFPKTTIISEIRSMLYLF